MSRSFATWGSLLSLALLAVAIPATASAVGISYDPAFGWNGNDGLYFSPTDPAPVPDNLALTSHGSTAFGSSEYGGGVHMIQFVNDGKYGNTGTSWIPAFNQPGGDPNPFIGIELSGLTSIGSFAFSRDNGNNVVPPTGVEACGGQCTDRWAGTYTIQYTTVGSPGAGTSDTGNAATGWATIGQITYSAADDLVVGGAFTPWFRHEFTLTGGPLSMTGFRILVPNDNINIDEISLYAPVPEPASLVLFGLGAVGLVLAQRKSRQQT